MPIPGRRQGDTLVTPDAATAAMGRGPIRMNLEYAPTDLSRDEIDKLDGATLLDFGTEDCVHCKRMHQTTAPRPFSIPPKIRRRGVARQLRR